MRSENKLGLYADTDLPIVDMTYETSPPSYHQPLSALRLLVALPSGVGVGVAKEKGKGGVYDIIDQ